MLKLKFFSAVSIFILILSSCEFVEDESITPVDTTSDLNGYHMVQDSVTNAKDMNFIGLEEDITTSTDEGMN
ncbi:hypothetical protein [Flammeovirga aprica]|uniref:Uncharacterized protein n=1 Tax=Flammeovirga aprica JL-4 TaxID=694437 RepID=A0A7X9S1K9_9BACT|nr:hypothetical protein [Flammeovirga aprica]NME72720.1 hypothetical protein [Flammeovirga aprica JL-4]